LPNFFLKASANGIVFGVTATSTAAARSLIEHAFGGAVGVLPEGAVGRLRALCRASGSGPAGSCHCTVGCTPTWLMPVMITSGLLAFDLVEDRREVGGVGRLKRM
jgi:hypothetical protein